jgi:hypothetical protein
VTRTKVCGVEVPLRLSKRELVGNVCKANNLDARDTKRSDMDAVIVHHCEEFADVLERLSFFRIVVNESSGGSLGSVQNEIHQGFSGFPRSAEFN